MDFLTKHRDSIRTYAKACPISMLIFMVCAIVTDEWAAWVVAYALVFATLITSLLAQLSQDFSEEHKAETESEKH